MTNERGVTIVEIMVTISVLMVVTVGFYSVMISGTASSNKTRSLAQASEEARLGFNRMMRDTREADAVSAFSGSSYTVQVDFNRDGVYSATPNPQGDIEILTFAHDAVAKTITLNGQLLVKGVTAVPGKDVFSYSSNRLEYDWNGDGVTTLAELQGASAHGITLTASEIAALLTSVEYAFQVQKDPCGRGIGNDCSPTIYYGQAQLRNKR